MSVTTANPTSDPILTETHHQALAAATQQGEPIHRAARVATFNAWTTAIIAGLSAPFALFGTVGLLVFATLAAVAWNEFRGRRRLLNYDPAGASILGWNQLCLLAMVTIYCLWSLYSNLWGGDSIEAQLHASPELGAAFGSLEGIGDLVKPIVVLFYGAVIALSVVFQGGNAVYYFTRRKYVENTCARRQAG